MNNNLDAVVAKRIAEHSQKRRDARYAFIDRLNDMSTDDLLREMTILLWDIKHD